MSVLMSENDVCIAKQVCLDRVIEQLKCELDHAYPIVQSVVIHMAGQQGDGGIYDPTRIESFPTVLDARIARICGEYIRDRYGVHQGFKEVKRLWVCLEEAA